MKFKKVFALYFLIKLFYLFFAIFVFSKLTTLGDTPRYLNSGVGFSMKTLYSSTELMDFIGSMFKRIFVLDIIACFPFTLLSFYGVYYAVDKLNLYKYSTLLFVLLAMPNFGVWTSILSKEAVGCFYSGVLAVMIVRFIEGEFVVKPIYLLALYLCLVFKPPYFFFIVQALVYVWVIKKINFSAISKLLAGIFLIALNILVIFIFRDEIDLTAQALYIHFTYSGDPELAQSTRENVFVEKYDFFRHAPAGMLISFFGPTISEMLSKPTHLITGIESAVIVTLFFYLWARPLVKFIKTLKLNATMLVTYLLIVLGILFSNYPFGILNPGSAVRYRENFYLLFVILFIYSYARCSISGKIKISKA